MEWTNQLLDIPFGDTFTMQTRMEARELPRNKSGTPECEVRMYLNVDWKKKVMWRRMIESNIHRETTESYETFIKVLKKHIQNDHVMDEGNTKSKAKEKLKVQTDLAESVRLY